MAKKIPTTKLNAYFRSRRSKNITDTEEDMAFNKVKYRDNDIDDESTGNDILDHVFGHCDEDMKKSFQNPRTYIIRKNNRRKNCCKC